MMMHFRTLILAALCLAAHFGHAAQLTGPVKVTGGDVVGVQAGKLKTYLGIPFAAPPVGIFRWRAPQAVVPWKGVKQARNFSPACAQTAEWISNPKSEDCLYLNVWSPERAEKLPVIVWIHGGGLYGGTAAQPLHNGANLAQRGAVVVTLNYRLGIFGFFAHPELSAESPDHVSGNQGILDQIAALRWVKNNIAAFGGDPDRVTIMGNSSGGESVAILVASPLAKGLFHRAIAESGNDALPINPGDDHRFDHKAAAEAKGQALAQAVGAQHLADLRKMSVKDLQKPAWLPRTYVDGHLLHEDMATIYRNHRQNDVPLLAGWVAEEGKDLAPEILGTGDFTAAGHRGQVTNLLGYAPSERLLTAYPGVTDAQAQASIHQLINDWWGWRMAYWAALQSKYGRSRSYVYFFAHRPAEPSTPCNWGCGVGHGVEIQYLLDNLDVDGRAWSPADRRLAAQLADTVIQFARTGSPSGKGLAAWPIFDGSMATVLSIGDAAPLPDLSMFPQLVAAPVVVSSPDGRIAIQIEEDASRFTIQRGGHTVIASSPLGLELDGAPAFGTLALERRDDVEVDQVIPLVATKAAAAPDRYRGATLAFRESSADGRRLLIDVRAYDDGVAFRYRLDDTQPVRLRGERTAFVPAGDPECLVSVVDGAHESPFERMKVTQLRSGQAYDVPMVCTTPAGRTAYAITQANLAGYTGASLWREGDALQVRLSVPPNRPAPAFESAAGLTTAWRVVMMGDREGDLIASNLIGNLNPPPTGDFSWVKPGKAAWDWYSGPLAGMKPDMDSYKRYIDFAAAAGLPYYLIDANWALGSGPQCWVALPTTDITRAAEGIDIPALVRYAAAKGVGLLLWAHWEHVAPRMDEVLDTYVRWGIKGVKVDFMNRDDQDMIAFYHRIAEATARRKLLLDLHGAYVPAGLQRTYPNFITQEGVRGAEWNKMGKTITPQHNLMLPYTRMLAGPMDYTPGGFHNATPDSFAVRELMPQSQTTRGQALAMYVVYDSPLQMVSDDPDAYRDAAGFDFIQRVPTAWDETRFISGTPGRDIVLARRKGSSWYLGAMTADLAKGGSVERVALDFLPPGRYRAMVWEDGSSPNDVRRVERKLKAGDVLSLRLAAAGGAAVILEKLP
ncbi:hypothetical protein RugamoR64_49590 [Duganella rhizosphaerae]|uniref:carboxylesterase family protein n=1 Tax=Duganella rhizosphaerae TaxID=2885763 RepID=UPI0030E9DC4C